MRVVLLRVAGLSVVGALTLGCGASSKEASRPDAASAPRQHAIPADLKGDIERSSAIGAQLYVLDKVSALATDALLQQVGDPKTHAIGGYVPVQEADAEGKPARSFLVTFFTRDDPPRAAYEVHVSPDERPRLEAVSPPKDLSALLGKLVRARQLAIATMPSPSQPINPVLMPAEAIGQQGVLVYLLAGTTKPRVAVLGKHYRAVVSDDGSRLTSMMPLSRGVLELPIVAPPGGVPAALTVTHVVTDFPLETHVFTSLLVGLPIYVGTRRGLWRVDGDRIEFLGNDPQ